MRRGVRRVLPVMAGALTIAAGTVVLPGVAQACSCVPVRTPDQLEQGEQVAIITQGATEDTFRVLRATDTRVPAQVGAGESVGQCGPSPAPGELIAAGVDRRTGQWLVEGCSTLQFGPALERLFGPPVPGSGGPPVAYVAGAFGGSRLGALDRMGAAVAWADAPGNGERVARCPGGRTLVAVGRTSTPNPIADPDAPVAALELTVHDAQTLAVQRRVELPSERSTDVLDLRCDDTGAATVEVLVQGIRQASGALLSVRGDQVTSRQIGTVAASAPITGAFLIALGGDRPSLVELRPGGKQRVLTPLGRLDFPNLAVSPDGRRAAVTGFGPGGRPVSTFEVETGIRIATTKIDASDTALTWLDNDTLLIRSAEPRARGNPAQPLQVRGADLELRATWPQTVGQGIGQLAGAAGQLLTYGQERLTVRSGDGAALVATDLRLAGAEHVVVLPGASFALPAPGTPIPGADAPGAPATASVEGNARAVQGVAAGLAALVVLGAGVVFAGRRLTPKC